MEKYCCFWLVFSNIPFQSSAILFCWFDFPAVTLSHFSDQISDAVIPSFKIDSIASKYNFISNELVDFFGDQTRIIKLIPERLVD